MEGAGDDWWCRREERKGDDEGERSSVFRSGTSWRRGNWSTIGKERRCCQLEGRRTIQREGNRRRFRLLLRFLDPVRRPIPSLPPDRRYYHYVQRKTRS